jgi:hypothetical protein
MTILQWINLIVDTALAVYLIVSIIKDIKKGG